MEEKKEALENEKLDEQQEEQTKRQIWSTMFGMFSAAKKVKSIRRPIRRGKLTATGVLLPKRPFNNRANSSKRKGANSREESLIKKRFYGFAKRRTEQQSL